MGYVGADEPLSGEPRRRPVEAVRRGAVRVRPASQRVAAPSSWEHVEVELWSGVHDNVERVAALTLAVAPGVSDPDRGEFEASISERRCHGDASASALCRTSGLWRLVGRAVELLFEASPALGLDEHIVKYRLRNNCLVADDAQLPDGLASEYSLCRSGDASTVAPEGRQIEQRPVLLAPEIAASEISMTESTTASEGARTLDREEDEEDVGDVPALGRMPVGIILDGEGDTSDEDVEAEWAAASVRYAAVTTEFERSQRVERIIQSLISIIPSGANPTEAAEDIVNAALGREMRVAAIAPPAVTQNTVVVNSVEAEGDEEYLDDFEPDADESDGNTDDETRIGT